MQEQDELLKMFFDGEFVPHAYLDFLLFSKEVPLKELQVISASLLSRLDYYTGRLTKELESTINKLQKPTEIISYSKSSNAGNLGTTKLEYFLDTLANSMKLLENDIGKINDQLYELDKDFEESGPVADELRQLQLVRTRLIAVLETFQQLRAIMMISAGESTHSSLGKINVSDFRMALDTLKDTILTKLNDSTASESPKEINKELLSKIDTFIALKSVLKGFSKFYPIYLEFSNAIQSGKDHYLSGKIPDELT